MRFFLVSFLAYTLLNTLIDVVVFHHPIEWFTNIAIAFVVATIMSLWNRPSSNG